MKPDKVIEQVVTRVRVSEPETFRLAGVDPGDRLGLDLGDGEAKDILGDLVKKLSKKQELLYAEGRAAVLAIFQAMDAGGKDGAIEKVFSGINPQGCQVASFKTPSAEELAHDFLWRTTARLPARGHIGVFNRSYYEEVLVVRVHPDWLARQKIAPEAVDEAFWARRFDSINAHEKHLARNGTRVLKFHLRISQEEQRKRLLERLQQPDKCWKFSPGDMPERALWDRYMDAYERMIRATSTAHAPWHVIPADRKATARIAVAAVLLDALDRIDPKPPEVSPGDAEAFRQAEATLLAEAPKAAGRPR